MQVEIKELLEAGAHFGYKTEKWNTKMKFFNYTKMSGIHIIDLVNTKEKLKEALEFIKKTVDDGKIILFVGTKKQAQQILKIEAEKAEMPFVNERWLGGTLTNFQTIIKQVKKLNSLREEKEKNEWDKFSKKEKSVKQKELENLERSIGGLEKLRAVPDALYIVDTNKEHLAVREARKLGIPIVGIVDSNGDPTNIDYPIPANDDALKVVRLVTEKVAQVIMESKSVEQKKVNKETGKSEDEVIEDSNKGSKLFEDGNREKIEEKLEEKKDDEKKKAKKTVATKVVSDKNTIKK